MWFDVIWRFSCVWWDTCVVAGLFLCVMEVISVLCLHVVSSSVFVQVSPVCLGRRHAPRSAPTRLFTSTRLLVLLVGLFPLPRPPLPPSLSLSSTSFHSSSPSSPPTSASPCFLSFTSTTQLWLIDWFLMIVITMSLPQCWLPAGWRCERSSHPLLHHRPRTPSLSAFIHHRHIMTSHFVLYLQLHSSLYFCLFNSSTCSTRHTYFLKAWCSCWRLWICPPPSQLAANGSQQTAVVFGPFQPTVSVMFHLILMERLCQKNEACWRLTSSQLQSVGADSRPLYSEGNTSIVPPSTLRYGFRFCLRKWRGCPRLCFGLASSQLPSVGVGRLLSCSERPGQLFILYFSLRLFVLWNFFFFHKRDRRRALGITL